MTPLQELTERFPMETRADRDAYKIIAKELERTAQLEDLLKSAQAIAQRKGQDTAWDTFSLRLLNMGITGVTPRTFRLTPSESLPTD